ncbi:M48 family metallopeptidase [Nitrosovibrio sp. Nv17]|uniref:M48 family metallopeptidase n=1 Tax=Nitrosovibrio sp. Nv17 TaxID=1855339 RepID=UPI000908BF3B|nr:SprT family zinc-dependent metalloprotease [Nitrosovibrio sp. Nv17]SFW11016.1 hypothetical protein SAMN05216414_101180 [Nitrosovibrio sp. Nv17]
MPASETRRIHLNGEEIAYALVRRARRTIGLRIDDRGLTVSAPPRMALYRIESALLGKTGWVLTKLAEWRSRESIEPRWEEGAMFPLLGASWQVVATPAGGIRMHPVRTTTKAVEDGQMPLPLPCALDARRIETFVMDWYDREARACFGERLALYADRLGIGVPPLRLSRARSRWGSCSARGIVRLNWRLIRMPLHLVDYVIAHELSHLIEMNHSPAFWKTVERIYPDYLQARKALGRLG